MIRIDLSRAEAGALVVLFVMLTGTVFVAGALSGYRAAGGDGVDVPVQQAAVCRCDGGVQTAAEDRDATPATMTAPDSAPRGASPREPRLASAPVPEPAEDNPGSVTADPASREDVPLFEIQVGAFANPANADALVARLRKRGYDPVIVQARARSGDWLRIVRLPIRGPESTVAARARAFSAQERLPAIAVPVR